MARVVGLTGGLASGKSAVAAVFRDLGAAIVSADAIAREVVEPGTGAHREIVEAFGPEILTENGSIDRPRLAAGIFTNPAARARLNAITHPHIRARMLEAIRRLQKTLPDDALIIVDIPLLLDVAPREAYPLGDVIVVAVDEATQLRRLQQRDGVSEGEARRRLRAQRPLQEKVAEADWVIDNSGSPEETRRQVQDLWARLTA